MKKATIILLFIQVLYCNLFGQAKRPTLMVVPSDAWCIQNGYILQFDDQGSLATIPDYKRAFQENTDLLLVTSKINGIMSDRGFPLQNMESSIKNLNSIEAEDAMRSSKNSGAEVAESPVDRLKAISKADIILQLTWSINQTGPKRSITFNLQGLDAYSNKQVATATGTGSSSFTSELPILLEEAVNSHMDKFCQDLQYHFDDLFDLGREISIRVKRWDDWEEDLESEFGPDNEELGFIIEDWMAENTKEGRFTTQDATENMIIFNQVRIPLYYERNGRQVAMDTRRFAKSLSDFLKNSPYNIINKITTRGLGEATIFLGSK